MNFVLLVFLWAALVTVVAASGFLFAADIRALRGAATVDRRWALGFAALVGIVTLYAMRARWSLPPHHVMYLDEPWYIEAAQSLLRQGQAQLCSQGWEHEICAPYPKALGWPVLLAGLFAVTGTDNLAAIRLATVLGALTVPLAASCARAFGASRPQALAAAVFVVVYPVHLAWSATAETNVPGAFFALLALLGIARTARDGSFSSIALTVASLIAAAAMRPEAALLLLPAAVAFLGLRGRRRVVAFVALAVAVAVSVAAVAPMWELNVDIAQGGRFLSLDRIAASLGALSGLSLGFHVLLVVFAGVAVATRRSALAIAVLVAGLGMLVVGLSFHQFADRLLLGGMVLLMPLAATLLPASRDASMGTRAQAALAIASIVVVVAMAARTQMRGIPSTQLLEVQLPALVTAAVKTQDALVVAEMPAVFSYATSAPVMATSTALSHGAQALLSRMGTRDVFFVCDMYCEQGFQGGRGPAACGRALQAFDLETVSTTELGHRRYGVYRVRGLRDSDDAPALTGCPM